MRAARTAVKDVLNAAIPSVGNVTASSPNEVLTQGGRRRAEKSWTLDGIGAQVDDVFIITGVVPGASTHDGGHRSN